jgi:hypothetical protein
VAHRVTAAADDRRNGEAMPEVEVPEREVMVPEKERMPEREVVAEVTVMEGAHAVEAAAMEAPAMKASAVEAAAVEAAAVEASPAAHGQGPGRNRCQTECRRDGERDDG